MTTDSKQLLAQQWQTLHNNFEDYEKYALIIKLVAILLSLVAFIFSVPTFMVLLLLATLWLQEGIWKTFQQRTENAIIAIEDKLSFNDVKQDASEPMETALSINANTHQPYLVYKQWHADRPGTLALVTEYIGNSLKPTVLYPYIPLMLIILIF